MDLNHFQNKRLILGLLIHSCTQSIIHARYESKNIVHVAFVIGNNLQLITFSIIIRLSKILINLPTIKRSSLGTSLNNFLNSRDLDL